MHSEGIGYFFVLTKTFKPRELCLAGTREHSIDKKFKDVKNIMSPKLRFKKGIKSHLFSL